MTDYWEPSLKSKFFWVMKVTSERCLSFTVKLVRKDKLSVCLPFSSGDLVALDRQGRLSSVQWVARQLLLSWYSYSWPSENWGGFTAGRLMASISIKTTKTYSYLDSYPRLCWQFCWVQRSVFGCHTGHYSPSATRSRRSERFSCGEGIWENWPHFEEPESTLQCPQFGQDHGSRQGMGSSSQWLAWPQLGVCSICLLWSA